MKFRTTMNRKPAISRHMRKSSITICWPMSFSTMSRFWEPKSRKSTKSILRIWITISKKSVSVSILSRTLHCFCSLFWNNSGLKSVLVNLFSPPVLSGKIFCLKIIPDHGQIQSAQLRQHVSFFVQDEKVIKTLFHNTWAKNYPRLGMLWHWREPFW